MGIVRLRNVTTGEIRDVESQSDEYAELINEIYDHDGSARPKWENTGEHHVRRMEDDGVQEADLGYKFKPVNQPVVLHEGELGPEQHPERALTEAEVESGIKSYDDKVKGLNIGSTQANSALTEAEPLERVDPEDRLKEGRKTAGSSASKSTGGSSGSGSRKKSSGGSGSSGSGSSSGSSGSSSSGSGTSSGGSNS